MWARSPWSATDNDFPRRDRGIYRAAGKTLPWIRQAEHRETPIPVRGWILGCLTIALGLQGGPYHSSKQHREPQNANQMQDSGSKTIATTQKNTQNNQAAFVINFRSLPAVIWS